MASAGVNVMCGNGATTVRGLGTRDVASVNATLVAVTQPPRPVVWEPPNCAPCHYAG